MCLHTANPTVGTLALLSESVCWLETFTFRYVSKAGRPKKCKEITTSIGRERPVIRLKPGFGMWRKKS